MSLKFKCQQCGKDIIVVHRSVGQTVTCLQCGVQNIIPENAEHTDKLVDDLIFKPRKLEEILSEAWRIYKTHLGKLWAIAAVSGVLQTFFFAGVWVFVWFIPASAETDATAGLLPVFMAGVFLGIALFFIVDTWVRSALVYYIVAQYAGRETTFGEAFGFAWKRLGTALAATILTGFAVGGLSLTIIGFPFAIYLGVAWSFAIQIIILESTGTIEALKRSYNLIKHNWWRIFGIGFLFGLIAGGVNSMISWVPLLGFFAAVMITMPIVVLASVLLYFDIRVRKENFTMEILESELHKADRLE